MDFVYIGIFMCALAFALVAVYASLVLKRTATMVETLGKTLSEVEQRLHYITPELRKTINETGKTLDELQDKMDAVDSMVMTLENVGVSVKEGGRFMDEQTAKASAYETPKNRRTLIDSFKWADVAYKLYKKMK
ncbi:Uncharacterized protein YoxC, contains an MCP-like domain [Lentibacillus persicus]|uniref:Uncharacterized protein YoxC, contains an MCP-like domain n=1 Tax=Lentibacillus persicus TaxID=640948 RepID=A0A1I2A7S2_9BACI|nr:DUF948 domain-containing protein [Lentibacillus persicus]SFE40144.1 Uncharacterized protein YoxC, contains an MCP-like domain [Lentibacillus persicus]